jgi:transcriptional regulator PpsR
LQAGQEKFTINLVNVTLHSLVEHVLGSRMERATTIMKRSPRSKKHIGDVDADTAARLIEASSDFALVLDGGGTILEVMSRDVELAARANRDWLGKTWSQTVTVESREKVAAMLRDAQAAADAATADAANAVSQHDAGEARAPARWRQVNHPTGGDVDLPMLYSAVRVVDDGRTPASGRILAMGRDLSATVALQRRLVEAQQAMERDYWRFREAETRYRSLFQSSGEAVLIVDGLTQKILEANPAALELCIAGKSKNAANKLVGVSLATLFDKATAESLQAMLAAARAIGKRDAVQATLLDSGRSVGVSASVFRQEKGAFVLVRLEPTPAPADVEAKPSKRQATNGRSGSNPAAANPDDGSYALLQAFIAQSPDAVLFTDTQGKVLSTNRAFAAMAQLSGEDQARGQTVDRWLGRTGVEMGVLMTNLRQRGSVGLFSTELRGEFGAVSEVEIAASALTTGDGATYALSIRDVGRRSAATDDRALSKVPRSVGQLTELVGRVPLKEIVSETTDLIEKLSIETALDMTSDNRASAAQLLGLSRQSLYVKLRRFGLGDLGGDGE